MSAGSLLEADGLSKTFGSGRNAVRAVGDVSLVTESGEVTLIMGTMQKPR